MTIPILVEPGANGFRAIAGGPFDLAAEAADATSAVAALREKIADRLAGGAVLIEQAVPPPRSPIPVMPLAANPLFDDWLKAVEEYRAERAAEDQDPTPA